MTNHADERALTGAPEIARLGDEMLGVFCERDPFRAEGLGFADAASRLTPRDDESRARHSARYRDIAARAEAVDPTGLSDEERLSRLTLMEQAASTAGLLDADPYSASVNLSREFSASGIVRGLTRTKVTTPAQAEAYLDRLDALPGALRQDLALRRRGVAQGRAPLASLLAEEIGELEAKLRTDPADDDLTTISVLPEVDSSAWRERVAEAVRDRVRPAIADLVSGLRADVLPEARDDDHPGVRWLPDGEELYRAQLRDETSMQLDPDDLRALGQRMWEAATEGMSVLGHRVYGESDVARLFDLLRNDDARRYPSPEAVLADGRAMMAELYAEASRWFGIPEITECLVDEMPSATALRYPAGQYKSGTLDGSRPGRSLINTSVPRYEWEIAALVQGGGIPGTHMYWNYAMRADVPTFRKVAPMHGFVKGWCGYALDLGAEFDLDLSPAAELGLWAKRASNASRLLTDVGLHVDGWSRDQAYAYRLSSSAVSERDARVDIERIIGIPGEGGVWCVGGDAIRSARAAAAAEGFTDLSAFHDQLLRHGALPLADVTDVVLAGLRARADER